MLTLRVFLGAVVSADWTEEQSCHSGWLAGKSGMVPDVRAPPDVQTWPGRQDYRAVRRLVKWTTPGTSGRSPWLR